MELGETTIMNSPDPTDYKAQADAYTKTLKDFMVNHNLESPTDDLTVNVFFNFEVALERAKLFELRLETLVTHIQGLVQEHNLAQFHCDLDEMKVISAKLQGMELAYEIMSKGTVSHKADVSELAALQSQMMPIDFSYLFHVADGEAVPYPGLISVGLERIGLIYWHPDKEVPVLTPKGIAMVARLRGQS